MSPVSVFRVFNRVSEKAKKARGFRISHPLKNKFLPAVASLYFWNIATSLWITHFSLYKSITYKRKTLFQRVEHCRTCGTMNKIKDLQRGGCRNGFGSVKLVKTWHKSGFLFCVFCFEKKKPRTRRGC